MGNRAILGVLAASLATTTLTGCSHGAVDGADAATQTAFRAVPITPVHRRSVCEMIPAREMSQLLGGTVIAKPQRMPGACTYAPAADLGPYAELRIDLGDGEAAMKSAGFVDSQEPGAVDPLAGLGDQAIGVGPLVMIRRGKDLISITVSGVDDGLSRVRAVYAAIDSRM